MIGLHCVILDWCLNTNQREAKIEMDKEMVIEYSDVSSMLSYQHILIKVRSQLPKEFCDHFLSHKPLKGKYSNREKKLD